MKDGKRGIKMNTRKIIACLSVVSAACFAGITSASAAGMDAQNISEVAGVSASKGQEDTIVDGVSIGPIDVSGMTAKQAKTEVKKYVTEYGCRTISIGLESQKITTTANDMGFAWNNPEVVKEAASLCKSGNVIKRYKDRADISVNRKAYEVEMGTTEKKAKSALADLLLPYEQDAVNASMTMNAAGNFEYKKEKNGISIDVATTAKTLLEKVNTDWDGSEITMDATANVEKPKYTVKDLKEISMTPLGTYTTYFSTYASSANRNNNIKNGARILNDILLYPGESYECGPHLAPWDESNGWKEAGTFSNGQVSTGMGGGICQVSTTLYNALLLAEVEITNRFNHSMTIDYVPLSADAAIAEGSKDLGFKNNLDTPIYIHSYYTEGAITYSVYGKETRPANRTIEYKSETIKKTDPGEHITEDPTKPKTYREVTSEGYTGYDAKLWKYIYIDGKLQKKELVNTSHYIATNTEIVVGTKEKTTTSKDKDTTKETTKKD